MKNQQVILTEINYSGEKDKLAIFGRLVTVFLILVGFSCVVFCFVPFSLVNALTLLIAELPIFLSLCIKNDEKWKYVKLFSYVVIALAILIFPTGTVNGLLNFVNQLIGILDEKFDWFITPYEISSVTNFQVLKFAFIIVMLISMGISWFVRRKKIEYVGLFTMILMIVAAYFNLAISLYGYAIFGIGLLISFLGENLFQQRVRQIFPLIIIIVFGIGVLNIVLPGFGGSSTVNRIDTKFLTGLDQMRYGEDTLPKGNLIKSSGMIGSEKNKTLKISGNINGEQYFKGFIGSKFEKNNWKQLGVNAYSGDMSGLIDWLSSKNFEPQFQLAQYDMLSTQPKDLEEISVTNLGAYSKYVYLPYSAAGVTNGGTKNNQDWQVISKGLSGKNEYSFKLSEVNGLADNVIFTNINKNKVGASDYSDAETIYRQFVYKNYLNISEDESKLIKEKFFKNKDWSKSKLFQLTSEIRLALQVNTKYSKTPTYYDGSENFVNWYLGGNIKCNSAYYATMAVLSYRSEGIPARYVEGYYLNPDTVKKQDDSIILSEADSHAWVEVYINGMGWLAVEVTPGFYSADFTLDGIAPSPDSSVNVVQNDKEHLNGSTKDTLKQNADKTNKQKKPIEKILHVLGIVLIIFILLILLSLILRIQRLIRKNNFVRKIHSDESSSVKCRIIFQRVCVILKTCKVEGDYRFPYECIPAFEENFESLQAQEFERYLQITEKSIFSNRDLDENEFTVICRFLERLSDETYKKASVINKLKMKYIYAL